MSYCVPTLRDVHSIANHMDNKPMSVSKSQSSNHICSLNDRRRRNTCSQQQSNQTSPFGVSALSAEVQEQELLLDLEGNPGLSLIGICKFWPEYGATSSVYRKSIQNKANWYKHLKKTDIAKYRQLLHSARDKKQAAEIRSTESLALSKTDLNMPSRASTLQKPSLQKTSSPAVTTLAAKKDPRLPPFYASPSGSSVSPFVGNKKNDDTTMEKDFASYEEAEAFGMWCLWFILLAYTCS